MTAARVTGQSMNSKDRSTSEADYSTNDDLGPSQIDRLRLEPTGTADPLLHRCPVA